MRVDIFLHIFTFKSFVHDKRSGGLRHSTILYQTGKKRLNATVPPHKDQGKGGVHSTVKEKYSAM